MVQGQDVPDELEDLFGSDEKGEVEKIVKELLGSAEEKTDLSAEQIQCLTMLIGIAEQYNLKGLQNLIKTFLRLQVSHEGKGRKGILEMLTGKLNLSNKSDFPPGFGGNGGF